MGRQTVALVTPRGTTLEMRQAQGPAFANGLRVIRCGTRRHGGGPATVHYTMG